MKKCTKEKKKTKAAPASVETKTKLLEVNSDACVIIINDAHFGVLFKDFQNPNVFNKASASFSEKLAFSIAEFLKDPNFVEAMIEYFDKNSEGPQPLSDTQTEKLGSKKPTLQRLLNKKTSSVKDLEDLVSSVFKM